MKNYEYGDVRKVAHRSRFTKEQIESALRLKCNTTHMLLSKAAMCMARCGDVFLKDLKLIKLDDVGIKDGGVKVKCGDKEFLVPFNHTDPRKAIQ